MPESKTHKRYKTKGFKKESRKSELPIGKYRLDAEDKDTIREVERSGDPKRIKHSIKKLIKRPKKGKDRELLVKNQDLNKAKKIAEETTKAKIRIQNLNRTKRRFINY